MRTTTGLALGAEIKRLREARGWTIRDTAKAADLDYSFLGKLEKGEIASVATYEKVAAALGGTLSLSVGARPRRKPAA